MNDRIDNQSRRRTGLLPLLGLAMLWVCPAQTARGEDECEYWAKAAFILPVSKNWRFTLEERLSFGDEARRLEDYQADYWFTYWGLADWFGIGPGYKQTIERDGDDWQVEDRPMLNIVVKGAPADVAVSSRSRFEYRIPEDGPESWRYRNQVTVVSPMTFTALKIQPYVSDEVFIELNDVDLSQQRLYGGIYIPLHKKVRLDLFYLWKLDRQNDGSWHDTNVLGSYVSFQF